ncbi:MAG: MBL fold metallo-hydrolase [Euryarchaeota archaeon]|nr:MBL fold metallo-hydrolase [Euryarchaeota archaeon]
MQEDVIEELGVTPVRRMNSRGNLAPHLSLRFDSHMFSIDTSRSPKKCLQPDAYLITHAHSDHYGKSAMLSSLAIASEETARALEIRYGREYKGRTCSVGESILVGDQVVETYPTGHTIGSVAFFWKNEVGTKTLVTGDVKNHDSLPPCDLLVTEANYGDPWDPACRFDDDITAFGDAVDSGATFGAYAFGKAQRAVALIRGLGYGDEIGMDEQSLALTQELMPQFGPFTPAEENGTDINVVTPWNLPRMRGMKYVLTGRKDLPYPRIMLSDHLDFRGLMKMIEKASPEATVVYHPEGERANRLALYLRDQGRNAISVSEVEKSFYK